MIFVYFDVSSQISELVGSNRNYCYYVVKDRVQDKNVFRAIYDCRLYQQFRLRRTACLCTKVLLILFGLFF